MEALLKAKIEATLNVKMNYPGLGILTRREFLEIQHKAGSCVEAGEKNRIQYNRAKYNRMCGWEQAEYERKCNERVPCWRLYYGPEPTGVFIEISKTEFEYFNSL